MQKNNYDPQVHAKQKGRSIALPFHSNIYQLPLSEVCVRSRKKQQCLHACLIIIFSAKCTINLCTADFLKSSIIYVSVSLDGSILLIYFSYLWPLRLECQENFFRRESLATFPLKTHHLFCLTSKNGLHFATRKYYFWLILRSTRVHRGSNFRYVKYEPRIVVFDWNVKSKWFNLFYSQRFSYYFLRLTSSIVWTSQQRSYSVERWVLEAGISIILLPRIPSTPDFFKNFHGFISRSIGFFPELSPRLNPGTAKRSSNWNTALQ